MEKLLYLIILILVSCTQPHQSISTAENADIKVDAYYKILSEEKNNNLNKCTLQIELKEKVSKEELAKIAFQLHNSRMLYDKVWIYYYLPGMKIGAWAWATTHFIPTLRVEINGSSLEDESKQLENSKNIDGKIIGIFYEQQYTSGSYTVFEKDNKTFVKMAFSDGSTGTDEMKKTKVSKGIKLVQKAGNPHGEYYILTKSGTLEFYNAENKNFTTANQTK